MPYTPEYIKNDITDMDLIIDVYDKVNRNLASIYANIIALESGIPPIPDTIDGGWAE